MIDVSQRRWAVIAGFGLLAGLAVLIALPADFFDQGQSICLSVVLFDRECYGCGMTRGVQHLLHLDFHEAWEYNKLAFVVVPLGLFLVVQKIVHWYRGSNS